MPELPEVETTRRGIAPHVTGRRVKDIIVRDRRLRWPVPRALRRELKGQRILDIDRRAKYLLFRSPPGTLIVHLGMTGSLCLVPQARTPGPHDHVDIVLPGKYRLRFNDPRRFGAMLWTRRDPLKHQRLAGLGPEPLSSDFSGRVLYERSRGRRVTIKQHLMNPGVVVGVGNIYASEALFRAGIHPRRAAGRIGLERMDRLAENIKEVLEESIRAGGTTLRDFVAGEGRPGYFLQSLAVYGRADRPCPDCGAPIRHCVLGQRSTFYCPRCQH